MVQVQGNLPDLPRIISTVNHTTFGRVMHKIVSFIFFLPISKQNRKNESGKKRVKKLQNFRFFAD